MCTHNIIEHDASLVRFGQRRYPAPEELTFPVQVHRDLDETRGTTPTNKPDPALIQAIIDASDGHKITVEDLIQAKFHREARAGINPQYPKASLATLSHGEIVLATEIMQRDGPGIPVEWFKTWLEEERLPDGFNPPNTTGILTVHPRTNEVERRLAALHAEAAKERRDA